jgi:hypothetical protein
VVCGVRTLLHQGEPQEVELIAQVSVRDVRDSCRKRLTRRQITDDSAAARERGKISAAFVAIRSRARTQLMLDPHDRSRNERHLKFNRGWMTTRVKRENRA